MAKKKIIILGNRGFLGAALYDFLRKKDESEIMGFNSSNLNLKSPSILNQIINCADKNTTIVSTARASSEPDPLKTFNQDLAITSNIAQFLKKTPVKKFVYNSSISIYGEDTANLGITEETKIAPSSHYGISKFTSEELLRKAAKEQETPFVVLRPCMIYGPGYVGLPYGPDRMVDSLVKNNQVEIFGDGSDRRDFLFINDFIKIIKIFIGDNCCGTYNLGTGDNYSPWNIVRILRSLTGNDFPVIKLKRTKPKINQKLDISKLKGILKDYVFTSLEIGLKRSLRSFQGMNSFNMLNTTTKETSL
mgnify:CR=1 FL=1